MKVTEFDCHARNLGLTSQEQAELTGFSWRVFAALAHLREAWINADSGNKVAIEGAIRFLLNESHSMRDHSRIAVKVLLHGHHRGNELLQGIRP